MVKAYALSTLHFSFLIRVYVTILCASSKRTLLSSINFVINHLIEHWFKHLRSVKQQRTVAGRWSRHQRTSPPQLHVSILVVLVLLLLITKNNNGCIEHKIYKYW